MNDNISLVLKCDPVDEARRLRLSGMSFREIAKAISISASSARNYTKDIILSKEQKTKLLSDRRKIINETMSIDYVDDIIEIKGKIKISYLAKKQRPTDEFIIETLSRNKLRIVCPQK